RIDNFGSCHFRYFLQYGLKARPHRRAEFDAPAAGTFMHYILENVTREIMAGGGFGSPAAAGWKALTDHYIDEYTRLYLGDMGEKTQRFTYLFHRLRRDVYQVVEDMVEELSRSEFQPMDFELTFGGGENGLPAPVLSGDGVEMALHGAVDRVDGWVDERDGVLYLRVVDYKTGKKKFKLSDVWYGMGMQMLLYLFTLVREGGEHYGGKTLEPAGVLYAPARDVIIPAEPGSSAEEIERSRRRELTRSGILVRDPKLIAAMEGDEDTRFIPVKFGKDGAPKGDSLVTAEELGRLGRHIDRTLVELGREMRAGDISARPHYGSMSLPCDYCDYRLACHYDPETDGARFLPPMSRDEVLEKLQEEDEHRG
ncbi:MAG: PD-(D/E)XK nuclease family protein, partial [Bacteroides sp.]|nr:PD-(D/E)XK nuclease family protein [Bacteroides sp.]